MDIVSTVGQTNNQLDIVGSETYWFRFVYFTAGSSFAINGGRDVPIINYEAVRSARGFDRITLKGVVVAEIGHGRDDPFPGTVSGIASNKSTYFASVVTDLDSVDIQAITIRNLNDAAVLRLRRVVVYHPGQEDSPQIQRLAVRLATEGPNYTGGTVIFTTGTADPNNPPLNASVVQGATTNVVDAASDIVIGIVPQDSHIAPTPVAPVVLDWQLQSYLQPMVARRHDVLTIGTLDGDVWATHSNISISVEFTQEPY